MPELIIDDSEYKVGECPFPQSVVDEIVDHLRQRFIASHLEEIKKIEQKLGFRIENRFYTPSQEEVYERDDIPNPFASLTLDEALLVLEYLRNDLKTNNL